MNLRWYLKMFHVFESISFVDHNLIGKEKSPAGCLRNQFDETLFLFAGCLAEGVVLQEPGEDEEEIGLGHRLSETDAATRSERHEAGWMLTNSTTLIKEMFCIERDWIIAILI